MRNVWQRERRLPPFWSSWPYIIGQLMRYLLVAAGLSLAIGEVMHGFRVTAEVIGGASLLYGLLTIYRSHLRGWP